MLRDPLPIVKLGKLLPKSYKNGIYKNIDSYGEGTPILRITDFDNEGNLITDELQCLQLEKNEIENYKLASRDIVINRVNSLTHIGKSILWQNPAGCITVYESNMMRIQPNEFVILPEYLIRVLQSEPAREHFRKLAKRAVAQCSINQQDVKSLTFPLPPLSEQQKIAQILSTWDKAITTTEQLLANSQQQKKALMQQLLTGKKRLLDKNGVRFSGEWCVITLGELGDTYSGLTGKTKEDFGKGKSYIPYINIFRNAKIDLMALEQVHISPEEKQARVQYGDVFFTTSSEVPEEVGMSSVLLDHVDELYLNSFCFGFRLSSFDVLKPEYAKYLFRSEYIRRVICIMGQGATRYNLSKKQLINLELELPNVTEQQKIATVLSTADQEITTLQQKLDALKQEKKALMQQLLTGKRRVFIEKKELLK